MPYRAVPLLPYNIFIDALFFLNGCSTRPLADGGASVISGSSQLPDSQPGRQGKAKSKSRRQGAAAAAGRAAVSVTSGNGGCCWEWEGLPSTEEEGAPLK